MTPAGRLSKDRRRNTDKDRQNEPTDSDRLPTVDMQTTIFAKIDNPK